MQLMSVNFVWDLLKLQSHLHDCCSQMSSGRLQCHLAHAALERHWNCFPIGINVTLKGHNRWFVGCVPVCWSYAPPLNMSNRRCSGVGKVTMLCRQK